MNIYPFVTKAVVTLGMSSGDLACQKLLDGLSVKELQILRNHPDLSERIREIRKMTLVQIIAELEEEFDLEVEKLDSSYWINTEKLEGAIPEWFNTSHAGWNPGDGSVKGTGISMIEWAKGFLMQEVRIDLWVRYLEHKKNEKPTKSSKSTIISGYV